MIHSTKIRNLDRFKSAQKEYIKDAVSELRNGRKETHWMWFMFPQIKGLGYSPTAQYYAIKDREEAEQYMKNPVLKGRLLTLCYILLGLKTNIPEKIFGQIDSAKLQSSMTLFYTASGDETFKKVLDKFFDGELCWRTIDILESEETPCK